MTVQQVARSSTGCWSQRSWAPPQVLLSEIKSAGDGANVQVFAVSCLRFLHLAASALPETPLALDSVILAPFQPIGI